MQVKELNNVYVSTDNTVILDSSLNVLQTGGVQQRYQEIEATGRGSKILPASSPHCISPFSENVRAATEKIKKGEIDKSFSDDKNYCCALPHYNCYVDGHLYDVTQRLKDFKDAAITNESLVVLPPSRHILNLYANHFKIHGFNTFEILKKRKGLYFFEKLFISLDKTKPAQVSPDKLEWLRKGYYDNILSKDEILKNNKRTKLFLTRNNRYMSQQPGRYTGRVGIKNEAEVWGLLKSEGFIILDGWTHDEDLKTHMDLFGRASLVVGAHGSLFRNSIFCLYDDVVFHEFAPINRQDTSIKKMSMSCGVKDYNQYIVSANDDYEVEINLDFLKSLLPPSQHHHTG